MKKDVLFLTNNNNSIVLYNWLMEQGEDVLMLSHKLTIESLKEIDPNIIISYNYKYIIGSEIINYMKGRIFNLHISLLPWNRGASPNYWSFVEDTPKGVTIHQIDKGLDTGDIVVQKEMFFDESEESFFSTYKKLNDRIVDLFIQNWTSIKNGTYKLSKQKGQGSYHTQKEFNEFTKGDIVDWDENIAHYKSRLERR